MCAKFHSIIILITTYRYMDINFKVEVNYKFSLPQAVYCSLKTCKCDLEMWYGTMRIIYEVRIRMVSERLQTLSVGTAMVMSHVRGLSDSSGRTG